MSVEPQKPQGQPSPPFIATAPALEALALLDRGFGSREPFVVVTGEPGVGKSMLLREALRRWGDRVVAREVTLAEVSAETLLAALLGRFGGTEKAQSGPALAQRLVEAIAHACSAGKVVVIAVDDAQSAAPELLHQLANLAEMVKRRQCAFEVILVGTPELSARLNDPRLASISGKATQVRLSPLTQHDTRHYLLQRNGAGGTATMFSRKACRDIHGATFGIPRAIEALADESARRAARAGVRTISPEHVRSATQALRARRGMAPAPVVTPRANAPAPAAGNGTNTPAPTADAQRPAAKPAPAQAAANGTNTTPVRAEPPKRAESSPAPGGAAKAGPPAPAARADLQRPAAKPAPAAPAPAAPKVEPAAAKAEPVAAKAEPAAAKAEPVAAKAGQPAAATPAAATSGEHKADSNDPRVKDWVSRFGGSGGVRIGMSQAIARFDAPAAMDIPPPAQTAAPNRILIVDEEPPFPPELVARLNKVSKQKRRRGISPMVQGTVLAFAVGLIVLLLARQAGYGKRTGPDAADTSARAVATPAAPLANNQPVTPGPGQSSRKGTGSIRLEPTPAEPTPAKASEPVAKSNPKSAAKKSVASAPAQPESLPAAPLTTTAPAPPAAPEHIEEAAATAHQRYGIIAGSFATNEMAKAEKDHLARLTTYRVWVTKSKVDGVRTFNLMVGRFDTMERAWEAGQTLMRRGLIRDANVRPLTEREAR